LDSVDVTGTIGDWVTLAVIGVLVVSND